MISSYILPVKTNGLNFTPCLTSASQCEGNLVRVKCLVSASVTGPSNQHSVGSGANGEHWDHGQQQSQARLPATLQSLMLTCYTLCLNTYTIAHQYINTFG